MVIALWLAAGPAWAADVYKCPVKGKTVYQDAPCDAKGTGATGIRNIPPTPEELREIKLR